MQEDRPRHIEVRGERVEFMKLVHAVGDGVGERVLLRIERAGLDLGDRLGEVQPHRHGAEQFEGAFLHVTRQHADVHALHVGRRVDRAQPVGDVAEAVLEPAEDAVVDALLGFARPAIGRARRPWRRAPARCWKTGTADRRSRARARGRSDSSTTGSRASSRRSRPTSEISSALWPRSMMFQTYSTATSAPNSAVELVADEFERLGEAGRGRAVAGHADLDWCAHGSSRMPL